MELRHCNEALSFILQDLDPATSYLYRRLREDRNSSLCHSSALAHLFPEIRSCDRAGLIAALSYGWGTSVGFIADMMPILPAWADMSYDEWRSVILRAHWFGLDWAIVPFMYQQLEVDAVSMVIELRPDDPEVAQDLRWPLLSREVPSSLHVDMSCYGLANEMLYQVRERLYTEGAPRARETPIHSEPFSPDESACSRMRMLTVLPPEGEEKTIPAYRRRVGLLT